MRKVNLVTTLSLTVVMLAMMAGIAAATEIDVDPQNLQLVPDTFVKTTATITGIPEPDNERSLLVSGPSWGDITDLTFRVGETGPESTGSITHPYTPYASSYVLDVYIKAAPGTEGNDYTLWYTDTDTLELDMVIATVRGTAIPEFTTIAIPVASILGLLFFFNHRKRKKE